jgi:hypothetical protein
MLVDVKLVGELGHGMELGVHPSAIELPCDLHWGCDMRHTEARAVVVLVDYRQCSDRFSLQRRLHLVDARKRRKA